MFNRFAAGKKVYGQGSYAPTKGQVNPQGYIQREIKKRNQQTLAKNGGVSQVGNDGQSDTRSGVAKSMLDNRGRQAFVRPQKQAIVRSAGGGNSNVRKPPSNGSGNSGNHSVASVNTAPVAPSVSINPTGQLQLPYGSEFANQVLDAQMAYDADMSALQQEEQANEAGYASSSRDLDKGYETQKSHTLNSNASAGTAFSSAYGVGVNEDSNNYLNAKNDLTAGYNAFKSGASSRRNQAAAALNSYIQRAMQGYTDSLAADAGELGFGTDAPVGVPVETAAPSAWDQGAVRPPKMPKIPKNNGGGGGHKNKDEDNKKKGKKK